MLMKFENKKDEDYIAQWKKKLLTSPEKIRVPILSLNAENVGNNLEGQETRTEQQEPLTQQVQVLEQMQPQRSLQASRQMLYDVYDYTIGMFEELEKHESRGRPIPNSGILSHIIPVSDKQPAHDVIGGIELELKVFEAQMKSHPPEVTNEARVTLVKQTIKWAASREDQGIPYGHVDHYCKNLLEILLFGANGELPSVERSPKIKPTSEQVSEAMYQMAKQRHHADQQDSEFERDPTKKAKLCNKRRGEILREGALRLAKEDPRIRQVLEEKGYVEDVAMETM